jgi:hypothetical protein
VSTGLDVALALEDAVWQALRQGDAQADARLLADDFVGVYESGVSDKAGHVEQLRSGPVVASYAIERPRLLLQTPDVLVLTYTSTSRHPAQPAHEPDRTLFVTSIWCQRDGHWVNVFSQDTRHVGERDKNGKQP